ncbi:unnamed protein product [Adineta ricciae]|uniref:Uncharacterized protein n=1 Tax=Adineta ricciae TaxID=249248 RepID=A0A814CFW8_ADIRI|nr:unnamed protein product [Adineta ricciae]
MGIEWRMLLMKKNVCEEERRRRKTKSTYQQFIVCILLLISYSLRSTDLLDPGDEEATVSVCQIRMQLDGSYTFDDRTLLSMLARLKIHDFSIGQPVWGPSDTVLYLCEHRLKVGLKQTILDKELHQVMKNIPISSGRLAWSCA